MCICFSVLQFQQHMFRLDKNSDMFALVALIFPTSLKLQPDSFSNCRKAHSFCDIVETAKMQTHKRPWSFYWGSQLRPNRVKKNHSTELTVGRSGRLKLGYYAKHRRQRESICMQLTW